MTKNKRQKMPFQHLIKNISWAIQQLWAIDARMMIAMATISLVGSILPASLAIVTRKLVNDISWALDGGINGHSEVLFPLILLFAITLLQSICSSLSGYLNQLFRDKTQLHISYTVMNLSSNFDVAFFENAKHQDMLSHVRHNTAEHLSLCYVNTLLVSADLVKLVSLSAILLIIEPFVALLIIPLFLPYLVFKLHLANDRYFIHKNQVQKRRWTQYYVNLLTHPQSISEIKLLGITGYFLDKFQKFMMEFFVQSKKLYRRGLVGNLLFSTIANITIIILLLRITRRVFNGFLTIGDVVVFLGASANLRNLLENLTQLISKIHEHSFYVQNYRIFHELSKSRESQAQLPTIDAQTGHVELRNVTFSYPGSTKPVLQDITLSIEPNETVALVGTNAAGKTTLAKLIAGLYKPDKGTITLDGKSLKDYPVEVLGEKIAFVFQNFGKYEATVATNIELGDWPRLEGDQESVMEIAKKVGINDVIQQYPQQYNTLLGRQFGNYKPSGGQWQYIAIARAFAREATLLILDEPTASLDVQTENDLFKNFRELTLGKTTLIISHKFSTVKIADRIVVLNEGKIIESGSHDELLENQGVYASMYHMHGEQANYDAD